MASPSVTQPIDAAMSRTGHVLFRTFSFEKWLVLGFCAFLAYLGENQGGGATNFAFPGGQTGPATPGEIGDWIRDNFSWLLAIVLAGAVITIAISLLILWLRCRANFMFIDGIVRNRGAVIEPWSAYRTPGNSLFIFYVIVHAANFIITGLIIAIAVAILWPDIQSNQFTGRSVLTLAIGIPVLLLVQLAFALVRFGTHHFAVPVMYLRKAGITDGWSVAWHEMIRPHTGPVLLFFLMRILIVIVLGIITTIAAIPTCCLVLVPYIGTVILLPLYVFERSYTLHFIEQFGLEYRIFTDAAPVKCAHCGYDLRYAPPASPNCPECGTPRPYTT